MTETRIDLILKNSKYFAYLFENSKREQDRPFCKHDWQHMRDVARIAYILALEKGFFFAKDIIYAAGLLHDIGRWKEYDSGEDHALTSAHLARELLVGANYSDEEIKTIVQAIKEHRKGGANASILGQILCRADDLARPCLDCKARTSCYKINTMETAKHYLLY
ncbi:HD domain-containing protein [Desulfolucanica intricata]|uniref:HD domain-containing protein n=1 Tax=Desulfolucanica intricata TaxID=1285191 RepID=UPI00082AA5B7|nr:HD domain-containing protein [Desulfolucanica intricata]